MEHKPHNNPRADSKAAQPRMESELQLSVTPRILEAKLEDQLGVENVKVRRFFWPESLKQTCICHTHKTCNCISSAADHGKNINLISRYVVRE
jgi:hypothetical protein